MKHESSATTCEPLDAAGVKVVPRQPVVEPGRPRQPRVDRAAPANPVGPPRRSTSMLLLGIAALVIAVLLPWISLGDHPLYSPDEGRYASAARTMTQTGDWIVPRILGEAHLTKPPLTYWLQAAAITVLGPTELAVRAPSALAASLLVLVVFGFGTRLGSARLGVLAASLLSLMPLHNTVGRLAITDMLLCLFWFVSLASGFCALRDERHSRRWALLMWTGAGLALLTKGPLGLMPSLILVIWLALTRQSRRWRRLHPFIGLPIAVAPLAAWGIAVLMREPAAWTTWTSQIMMRASWRGEDVYPIWFYLPILLAGMFPATVMTFWRRSQADDALHNDSRAAWPMLWIAVLLPLAMFSLMGHKLATYILPVCPAMAILAAFTLEQWLSGHADRASRTRLAQPGVVGPLTVATALAVLVPLAAIGFDLLPDSAGFIHTRLHLWMILPLIAAPLAASALWWWWVRCRPQPHRRAWGLFATFVVFAAAGAWLFEVEDSVVAHGDVREIIRETARLTGVEQPLLATIGFTDPTLSFYTGHDVRRINSTRDMRELEAVAGDQPIVLLADARDWPRFSERVPQAMHNHVELGRWHRWAGYEVLIVGPKPPSAP